MNYFNYLDEDIILLMISRLYSQELKKLSIVNKEINNIIKNNWNVYEHNIFYNKYSIYDIKIKLLKKYGIIYSIKNSRIIHENKFCYYYIIDDNIDFIKVKINYPTRYNKDIKCLITQIIHNMYNL